MTLAEMIEFDVLRYKQERTVREETRYKELEERVILGADGKSEFPTNMTAVEANNIKEVNRQMHDELCTRIAQRFFKDLAVYGPDISNNVMKIVIQIIKTLKNTSAL